MTSSGNRTWRYVDPQRYPLIMHEKVRRLLLVLAPNYPEIVGRFPVVMTADTLDYILRSGDPAARSRNSGRLKQSATRCFNERETDCEEGVTRLPTSLVWLRQKRINMYTRSCRIHDIGCVSMIGYVGYFLLLDCSISMTLKQLSVRLELNVGLTR